MSIAAKIRLRKLATLQAASAVAVAAREQADAAEQARRAERLAQPFDQDTLAPVASIDPANANAASADVSPATSLRQRKLARLEIDEHGAQGLAPDRSRSGEGATEYELLLAALGEDEAALKSLQGTERKEEAKRHMISKYDAHVDATLEASVDSGKAVQDEIVAMMMIWRFDIGDFERGLDIAEHMLRHGLRLPAIKNFVRTPATIICENVAEAGLRADGVSKDFDVAILHRAAQLTADFDMPDQVRAKMAKATALHLLRGAEAADSDDEAVKAGKPAAARRTALDLLRRALELDKNSGVKKNIERVESWLKKHVITLDADSKADTDAAADAGNAADDSPKD
ncbi:phage terminase small subunit [Sphingopyxis yananensis]|uniref:phage terminase small subunit n=1 Tax=Sphingopyxis yananensis TaxID=2886687 RepID=UPI001D112E06|nr:phage terminase small subunit [Sphingopyxis yananensis]MCC2602759.1 hypothetical protein [Sphingopyxis yananensis]